MIVREAGTKDGTYDFYDLKEESLIDNTKVNVLKYLFSTTVAKLTSQKARLNDSIADIDAKLSLIDNLE